jgi:hypothetical protein
MGLFNNYISFIGKYYLQLCGTAMGTPLAVVFANIYVYMLENEMFHYTDKPEHKNLLTCNCPINKIYFLVRFIDDTF